VHRGGKVRATGKESLKERASPGEAHLRGKNIPGRGTPVEQKRSGTRLFYPNRVSLRVIRTNQMQIFKPACHEGEKRQPQIQYGHPIRIGVCARKAWREGGRYKEKKALCLPKNAMDTAILMTKDMPRGPGTGGFGFWTPW